LEQLISAGRYGEAAAVWRYVIESGGDMRPRDNTAAPSNKGESTAADGSLLAKSPGERENSNLIYNGNFEQPLLNAGFDWRIQPQRYVAISFVPSEGVARAVKPALSAAEESKPAQSNGALETGNRKPETVLGKRSLLLRFTVPDNSDYEPVHQLVPVVPGQTYLLSAFVRSEAITSDSGPRLRVTDPKCPACLNVETEDATGSSPWRQVSQQFQAGPETEVVRVSVWRPHGRSFPMDISGRFWVDDVSLRAVPSEQ